MSHLISLNFKKINLVVLCRINGVGRGLDTLFRSSTDDTLSCDGGTGKERANAGAAVEVKPVGLVHSFKTTVDTGELGVEGGPEVSSWTDWEKSDTIKSNVMSHGRAGPRVRRTTLMSRVSNLRCWIQA